MFDFTMDWRFSERQDTYGFTRVARGEMRYWALVAHFTEAPHRISHAFDYANATKDGVGSVRRGAHHLPARAAGGGPAQ